MPLMPPDRIIGASSYLLELNGATLGWWTLVVSLGEFRLLASDLPRGLAEITLGGASYVDCPVTMHGVRLRVAADWETDELRQRLPSGLADSLQREDHLIIECDEGKGSI